MEYEWDISWNHIPGVAEDEGFCSVPNHVLLLIIKKADFIRFVNGLEFALIYLHLDHVWGFYVARHM